MHLLQFLLNMVMQPLDDLVGHGRSYRNGPGQIGARHTYRHFIEDAKQCSSVLRMPCQRRNRRSPIFYQIGFGFGSMLAKQYAIMTSNCNALIHAVTTVFPLCIERQWSIYAKECQKADTEPAEKRKTIFSHVMALM